MGEKNKKSKGIRLLNFAVKGVFSTKEPLRGPSASEDRKRGMKATNELGYKMGEHKLLDDFLASYRISQTSWPASFWFRTREGQFVLTDLESTGTKQVWMSHHRFKVISVLYLVRTDIKLIQMS